MTLHIDGGAYGDADAVRIETPTGVYYLTESDNEFQPGLMICSERSMMVFPRGDNSLRLMAPDTRKSRRA